MRGRRKLSSSLTVRSSSLHTNNISGTIPDVFDGLTSLQQL